MLKVFSTLVLLFVTSFAFSQENKVPLCGTPDSQILDAKVLERMRNAGKNPNLRMADLPMLECLVAVAVENKIYEKYGKNHDLIREYVYRYFDKVSKIFEDEVRIKLTVAHIEIIESQRSDTLNKTTQMFGYHIGHLFTLNDAIPKIAAGYAIVEKNSYGKYRLYCVSGNFEEENYVAKVMAHEIGHCFDSMHTHNCNWPNGPIDYCSDVEGTCDTGGRLPSIGTIMSYCSYNKLTFHPYCREVMRKRAEEILRTLALEPYPIAKYNIVKHNISAEPIISWKWFGYQSNTIRYRIQISDNQDFNGILIDSLVAYPFFKGYGLNYGKEYFFRIKSINATGESKWSELDSFICTKNSLLSSPVTKEAVLDSNNINYVRLEAYPVNGAIGYEFRLRDNANYYYDYYYNSYKSYYYFRTNKPVLEFKQLRDKNFNFPSGTFFWEVSTIKPDSLAGPTSIVRSFNRFKLPEIALPQSMNNLPTTFPIIWNKGFLSTYNDFFIYGSEYNREYLFQLSEDPSFSKIIYENNRVLNKVGDSKLTDLGYEVVEKLKPNSKYYFRFKEKSGVASWVASNFSTGSENNKWKFISPFEVPSMDNVYQIAQSHDLNKFIFTNNFGVQLFDGKNWSFINSLLTKGLVGIDKYSKAKIGVNNNLYFTNYNQSLLIGNEVVLFEYDGEKVTKILSDTLLNGRRFISDFYFDKKNQIYVVLSVNDLGEYEIAKYNGEKWFMLPSKKYSQPPIILFDNNDNIIVKDLFNGIFKLNGNVWEQLSKKNQFDFYPSFRVDSENNVWWADETKIYKRGTDNIIKNYDLGSLVYISDFIFDRKGILWLIGSYKSKVVLLKFQNNQWQRIDELNDIPIPNLNYSKLLIDKQNRVCLFSEEYGVFIYDDTGLVKSQEITAEKILNRNGIGAGNPIKIIASSSSGLPLSYKLISGPAIIKNDSIYFKGENGKVSLQMSQSGNEIYEPAKNVELSFDITLKLQSITFTKIEQKILAEKSFTLSATTTSGLPITYQIISGPATVNGNVVTLTGTGRVLIKAIQNGNAEFLAANEVIQEFCVIPAKPIISVNAANNWMLEVNADKNLQWYFNGTKVENGTKSTLLATQNGQYKVEVFNADASCAANTSDIFQLLILANEDDKNQSIKVFPNPADDWVTVDSENLLKINSIKLYDLKGSLLYTNEKTEFPHKIKIQSSWQGNVLLEIKTNDKTYLKKLVLN